MSKHFFLELSEGFVVKDIVVENIYVYEKVDFKTLGHYSLLPW